MEVASDLCLCGHPLEEHRSADRACVPCRCPAFFPRGIKKRAGPLPEEATCVCRHAASEHAGSGTTYCLLKCGCARFVDNRDLADPAERKQKSAKGKALREASDAQLAAALLLLNSTGAADLLAARIREACHGEPMILCKVFEVLQIGEKQ